MRVRRRAKFGRTAAEDLALGEQLDIHFQPDHRLIAGKHAGRKCDFSGHFRDYICYSRGGRCDRVTVDEELSILDDNVRRLKIEYDIFFGGGSKKPPADLE